MTKEVVIVKLTSRETLVGKLVSKTADFLVLEKPCLIIPRLDEKTRAQRLEFEPYAPFAEDFNVSLYSAALAHEPMKVAEQMKHAYLQVIGEEAQLIVPEKKLILPGE